MNTTTKDMGFINDETDYVVGLERKSGNRRLLRIRYSKGILASVEKPLELWI